MILFQMSFSRKDAGKLALTVTIVSENLGSEIRKELRWAEGFKNVKKSKCVAKDLCGHLEGASGGKAATKEDNRVEPKSNHWCNCPGQTDRWDSGF